MTKKIAIGFDHSHNNKLTIENNAFTDFIQYLFDSAFKLGKIEAGFTYEKLNKYDLFIIGVPHLGPDFDIDEISALVKYAKDGGSLLVINDGGGDYENKNNLSELTKNFGIVFNSDILFDNKNFSKDNAHPIIKDFRNHFITRDIYQIIHSNGCSLVIDKSIEDENINVNSLAFSSETTSWHRYFNGNEWQDKSEQQLPIIGATHYGPGKVIVIGNLSIFSSLKKSYGIRAADNFKLVTNMISWLLNKAKSDEQQALKPILTTVAISQDLFYWIKEMINKGKWANLEEVINFALRVTKTRLKDAEKNDNNE
ncbi:MAG: hypothetical protein CEE43_16360 [Promethearchaeota archaeon Loki_b32]|nr:MAG: hypothetical protein CEE43_16360 [Candidatus Lokiarchaeota archaeon Loki_b32]